MVHCPVRRVVTAYEHVGERENSRIKYDISKMLVKWEYRYKLILTEIYGYV